MKKSIILAFITFLVIGFSIDSFAKVNIWGGVNNCVINVDPFTREVISINVWCGTDNNSICVTIDGDEYTINGDCTLGSIQYNVGTFSEYYRDYQTPETVTLYDPVPAE